VVAIELDIPAKFFELVDKSSVHKVDRTLIDAWLGLTATEWAAYNGCSLWVR